MKKCKKYRSLERYFLHLSETEIDDCQLLSSGKRRIILDTACAPITYVMQHEV